MHVDWPSAMLSKKKKLNQYFHLTKHSNAWSYNLYSVELRMDISQKLVSNSETT